MQAFCAFLTPPPHLSPRLAFIETPEYHLQGAWGGGGVLFFSGFGFGGQGVEDGFEQLLLVLKPQIHKASALRSKKAVALEASGCGCGSCGTFYKGLNN